MPSVELALVLGFVIMALASLAIYAHGDKRVEYLHHTQFHSTVPFLAATAYLAMALGVGRIEVDGNALYLARYADWSVTTPILLTCLIMTGLHEHPKHSTFILPALVLDVVMIATGLLAALARTDAEKWIWFAWSCAAFAGIAYLLLGPVMAAAREMGGRLTQVYRANLVFLLGVWALYPVQWVLGSQGLGILNAGLDAWTILILDVTAKVVYGFVATARFKRLSVEDGTRDDLAPAARL